MDWYDTKHQTEVLLDNMSMDATPNFNLCLWFLWTCKHLHKNDPTFQHLKNMGYQVWRFDWPANSRLGRFITIYKINIILNYQPELNTLQVLNYPYQRSV